MQDAAEAARKKADRDAKKAAKAAEKAAKEAAKEAAKVRPFLIYYISLINLSPINTSLSRILTISNFSHFCKSGC